VIDTLIGSRLPAERAGKNWLDKYGTRKLRGVPDRVGNECRCRLSPGSQREPVEIQPVRDGFEVKHAFLETEVIYVPIREASATPVIDDYLPAETNDTLEEQTREVCFPGLTN
jgi:hypothetical protein